MTVPPRPDSEDTGTETQADPATAASAPTANTSRRAFLTGSVGAIALLAGCSESTDGPDDIRGPPEPAQDTPATPLPNERSFMADANNYHGYANHTDESTVTVAVGVSGEAFDHAFEPAGLVVSEGTRVVWEWSDGDATHGVTERNGGFESTVTDESGHTFERTFEDSSIHRYYCPEHRSAGMKGAVLVQAQ